MCNMITVGRHVFVMFAFRARFEECVKVNFTQVPIHIGVLLNRHIQKR